MLLSLNSKASTSKFLPGRFFRNFRNLWSLLPAVCQRIRFFEIATFSKLSSETHDQIKIESKQAKFYWMNPMVCEGQCWSERHCLLVQDASIPWMEKVITIYREVNLQRWTRIRIGLIARCIAARGGITIKRRKKRIILMILEYP